MDNNDWTPRHSRDGRSWVFASRGPSRSSCSSSDAPARFRAPTGAPPTPTTTAPTPHLPSPEISRARSLTRRHPLPRLSQARPHDPHAVRRRVQGRPSASLPDRPRVDSYSKPRVQSRRHQRRRVHRLLASRTNRAKGHIERTKAARVRRGGARHGDVDDPGNDALGRRVLPTQRGGQRDRTRQVRHPPPRRWVKLREDGQSHCEFLFMIFSYGQLD